MELPFDSGILFQLHADQRARKVIAFYAASKNDKGLLKASYWPTGVYWGSPKMGNRSR
jgi:hypothetical protein